MGEDTRMNLDTSYYNGEKTEYTVDHRTQTSNQTGPIKNEINIEDNNTTHYEMGTHNDQIHSQSSHYMNSNINSSTVVVDDDDGPNTFVDRKVMPKDDDIKDEKKNNLQDFRNSLHNKDHQTSGNSIL